MLGLLVGCMVNASVTILFVSGIPKKQPAICPPEPSPQYLHSTRMALRGSPAINSYDWGVYTEKKNMEERRKFFQNFTWFQKYRPMVNTRSGLKFVLHKWACQSVEPLEHISKGYDFGKSQCILHSLESRIVWTPSYAFAQNQMSTKPNAKRAESL